MQSSRLRNRLLAQTGQFLAATAYCAVRRPKMTYDKNVSPTGWYVGSYVQRFVELAEPGRDDSEKKFASWENTVLVRASSFDEAYEKLVAVGMENSTPYKGGPTGIDVQWIFEGVTELLPVYEELTDGCEIMWANHRPKKLKNIRSRVKRKEELRQ